MRIPVDVITRNTADPDELPNRRRIDHDDHKARVWLGKHCYWAIRNGYSVTTVPVTDAE